MNRGNITIKPSSENKPQISVILSDDGTVWMTVKEIANTYNIMASTVSRNIKDILSSGELRAKDVRMVLQKEVPNVGMYQVECYNLDMIVALSFRMKSLPCLLFRKWIRKKAVQTLREYSITPFILQLKNTGYIAN